MKWIVLESYTHEAWRSLTETTKEKPYGIPLTWFKSTPVPWYTNPSTIYLRYSKLQWAAPEKAVDWVQRVGVSLGLTAPLRIVPVWDMENEKRSDAVALRFCDNKIALTWLKCAQPKLKDNNVEVLSKFGEIPPQERLKLEEGSAHLSKAHALLVLKAKTDKQAALAAEKKVKEAAKKAREKSLNPPPKPFKANTGDLNRRPQVPKKKNKKKWDSKKRSRRNRGSGGNAPSNTTK
jgi:hypothetical protein